MLFSPIFVDIGKGNPKNLWHQLSQTRFCEIADDLINITKNHPTFLLELVRDLFLEIMKMDLLC